MNSNGFLSSNSNLQSMSSNDRLKSFFKPSQELPGTSQGQQSYTEALKVDISKGFASGRQVFSKSIEFSLGVKFQSSYEFKIPTPKDVAATVLGFVENRINAEKSSGASTERLNDLMAQAKSGIEKGYAQAEKDIKDLGLMTEELSEEISEGFDLINQGLDKITQEINLPLVETEPSSESAIKTSDPSLQEKPYGSSSKAEANYALQSKLFSASEKTQGADDLVSENVKSAYSLRQLTENTADFVLNTQEGDQVLIRMSDLQLLAYNQQSSGESLNLASSSDFQFSVKGDLNEDELKAINNILEQVGEISSLFFSDQFEEAFSSAMSLGFDSSQIASFALDLSKLQAQEVRTYEESPRSAMDSYKRNQPLVNMAQHFEHLDSLIKPLERFEKINSIIEALVFKAIDRYSLVENKENAKVENNVEGFKEFSKTLLDSVFLSE